MKNLILLHGAAGSKTQLTPVYDILRSNYNVHTLPFPGHGGEASDDAFSIPLFAEAVIAYMKASDILTANIFGYSMGGYVAVYLARHRPELVEKIITLGTKYHWDEATALTQCAMLDADTIRQKVPKYAAALAAEHGEDGWKTMLQKTQNLLQYLGRNNTLNAALLKEVNTPVMLLLGDRDRMVTMNETLAAFDALPAAQLGILPATPHPIDKVDNGLLAFMIQKFLG